MRFLVQITPDRSGCGGTKVIGTWWHLAYYRWRQQYAPDQVDTDRRCRELELEVDRLKRLVAELLLDKQMLQDIAKKKW
jgi:hypothetical protein